MVSFKYLRSSGGTGILRNELYIGLMVWNRQRYIKDPVSGKRQARMNPPEQWVTQPLPELRIVDQALWDAVAARLDGIRQSPMVEKARSTKFWEQRRPQHLLTGLARCGVCSSLLAAVGKNYLACSAAHRHGTCANRRAIPRPALETLVLDALKHQLMHPDAVKAFIEGYVTEVNRQSKRDVVARQQKQRELAEVTRKIDGMIEAITDGFRSPGLQEKLTAFEESKRQLEQELSGAIPPAPILHPNLAELYRRRVAELQEAIADPHCRDEALGLIRGLVEAVVLHPLETGFEIELVGEIANMVALAAGAYGTNSKAARAGAAVDGVFRRSVKLVAGACNHRQLTLLRVEV